MQFYRLTPAQFLKLNIDLTCHFHHIYIFITSRESYVFSVRKLKRGLPFVLRIEGTF